MGVPAPKGRGGGQSCIRLSGHDAHGEENNGMVCHTGWCGVNCTLVPRSKMAKKEFEQPIDASWEGVQVIVATATLTIAVDPPGVAL